MILLTAIGSERRASAGDQRQKY